MKRNNEKIIRKKKSFPTHKMCFFFPSYWTPFIFKASNFFISPLFLNDLKCYRSTTLISTNHMWSLIATKQYTILVSWLGLVFVVFGGLFFFLSSSPPLLWGAITFSILIRFFDDFQICQQEGFKFCLDTKKTEPSPWIRPKSHQRINANFGTISKMQWRYTLSYKYTKHPL